MAQHQENRVKTELVIPSYNRTSILIDTLRSVRRLYPDLKVCVGLQDKKLPDAVNACTDGDPNVRVELLSTPSTTRTLNHCIRSSDADIILILDDDAVPCVGWMEAHAAAFREDPDLLYTCGREVRSRKGRSIYVEGISIIVEGICGLFLQNDKKVNGRIVGWINTFGLMFGNFTQPGNCRINSPRGCNMAVSKASFMALAGFNENFRGNAWGFEADFGIRAARSHKLGRYIGDAIVIHHEAFAGGSRERSKAQWYRDFLYNHKVLISTLGPQAWLGSLPRLIKKWLF